MFHKNFIFIWCVGVEQSVGNVNNFLRFVSDSKINVREKTNQIFREQKNELKQNLRYFYFGN